MKPEWYLNVARSDIMQYAVKLEHLLPTREILTAENAQSAGVIL